MMCSLASDIIATSEIHAEFDPRKPEVEGLRD